MRIAILSFALCSAVAAQTIPAGTVVLLRLEQAISSKSSKVNDRVFLRVETPIAEQDAVLIPAGSYAEARIAKVRRSPRLRGQAELLIEIRRIRLQNGAEWSVPSPRFQVLPKVRPNNTLADHLLALGIGTFGLYTVIAAAYESPEATAFNGVSTGVLITAAVFRRGPEIEVPAGTALEVVWDQDAVLTKR